MKRAFRSLLTLAVAALMMGSATARAEDGQKGKGPGGPGNNNNQPVQVRLRTTLAGTAIGNQKPGGNADFRDDGQGRTRLAVEVENVNLPAGTVLTVAIVHAGVSTTVGTITLGAGFESELELDSQHGDVVPAVVSGDMVTVSNGAAAILAGAF
jgi:uncharacterized phage protein gp47/JayE